MLRPTPPAPIGYTVKTFIERKTFTIPTFQRRYDWKNDQVRDLWDDLCRHVFVLKNQEPIQGTHYFGNSIIHKTDEGILSLIDGQQRTLTFMALTAAFRDFFKEQGMMDASRDARELLWERQKRLSYITSSNKLDDTALQELLDPEFSCGLMGPSLKRLHKTYRWFLGYIEATYKEELKTQHNDAEKTQVVAEQWFWDYLSHSHVTAVICDSWSEAIVMFKAHNTRGMDLDGSDVVKVILMDWLKKCGYTEEFTTLWSSIDENCKERPQHITYMLGDFFKAKTGGMITSAGIITHWENMLKITATKSQGRQLISQLTAFSKEWARWFYQQDKNERQNDLERMRVSIQFAPLLAAHCATSRTNEVLQKGFTDQLMDCIEYVHIHAKLVGMEDSNTLKKTYVNWANWMWKAGNPQDAVTRIIADAKTFNKSTIEVFRNNLRHINNLTVHQSRFLLRKIEMLKSPGLTPNDMNHLEHIAPKVRKGGWEHIDWDDNNTNLNNLGNLTLLLDKDNMSVGNKPWKDKKPVFAASALKITKSLSTNSVWNDETIVARCDELAGYLYDKLTL